MSEKWGERAMERFMVQGAKEVAQVIPAFKDSVQVVEEPAILPPENKSNNDKKPEIEMDR